MSDDKKKEKEDRNLISFKESYEFNYAVKQLQRQTDSTRQEAKDALVEAAKELDPSRGRERIMKLARKLLKD